MRGRTLFLLFFLWSLPIETAYGCGMCGMSLVHLLFPFMWEATWVLTGWYIANLSLQLDLIKKNPVGFLLKRMALLILLWFAFHWACFFIFLVGSFSVSLFRMVKGFADGNSARNPRFAIVAQAIVILVLVPTVANAYAVYSKQDKLTRLRLYVYPGTSQSMFFAKEIAKDPSVDLKRIRKMIESISDWDSQKAFEILQFRKDPHDLLELQDIVLAIPESEYYWETSSSPRTSVYLPLWLESITGKQIKTKVELQAWISEEEKKVSGTAEEGTDDSRGL